MKAWRLLSRHGKLDTSASPAYRGTVHCGRHAKPRSRAPGPAHQAQVAVEALSEPKGHLRAALCGV